MRYAHLLDADFIMSHTPHPERLRVALRKDPVKGTSLFANKNIKRGSVIAYYKIRLYNANSKWTGPFGDMYRFTVYTKGDRVNHKLIGNLGLDSVEDPRGDIPFWAYFSNEPSGNNQTSNAEIDVNPEGNYLHRRSVKEGDYMIYKLIATRNIQEGEEIVWCYGANYERSYVANCQD
jgi:hypothetical protein